MKKKDIITKWLDSEHLTDQELEAFKNLDAFDSYVKISDTAKKFKAPLYDVDQNLNTLKDNLVHQKQKQGSSYLSLLLRIAAVFVLGIGIYFFYPNGDNSTQTLASQKTTIELPDKTFVRLNAVSSIEYQENDWENNRNINLQGEAYFKVAKGKKFDVLTSSGTVSVLGTEFNVKQREDYFEVVCYEGLVSVTYNNQTIKLPAGKGFELLQGKPKHIVTTLAAPEWVENRSTFISKPYYLILEEFERQYNVTIIAKNSNRNQLFTGNFVHSDIEIALQSITIPMHLKYNINNNKITLYKE